MFSLPFLFDAARGIRGAEIQFHDVLSGIIARIFDGDGQLELRVFFDLRAVRNADFFQCPVKRGIRKPVAERIDDRVVVVLDEPLFRRRLVPAVAEIDVFLIDDVAARRRFVAHRVVRKARLAAVIIGVGVREPAARADEHFLFTLLRLDRLFARDQVRDRLRAAQSRRTAIERRVDALVGEETALHVVGGVEDDDDLFKGRSHLFEHVLLFCGEVEIAARLVRLAREVIHRDGGHFADVLAAVAGEHDDRRVAEIARRLHALVRIEGVVRLLDLAVLIHGHPCVVRRDRLFVGLNEIGVVLKPRIGQALQDADALFGVRLAGARTHAREHPCVVQRGVAEHVDLVVFREVEGQGVVLVFEKDGALFAHFFDELRAQLGARGVAVGRARSRDGRRDEIDAQHIETYHVAGDDRRAEYT